MPARATTVTACIRRHGGWNRTAYSALARLGPPTPEFPWLQADYEQTRQELRVRRAAPRGDPGEDLVAGVVPRDLVVGTPQRSPITAPRRSAAAPRRRRRSCAPRAAGPAARPGRKAGSPRRGRPG